MSTYLDTSVLVPLFVNDALTARAEAYLSQRRPTPTVSDLTAAEFSSALARRVRTGENTAAEARAAFLAFDGWTLERAMRVECTTFDVRRAELTLRRLDLPLRAPDAIHLAIAQRLALDLATFDVRLAESARQLGVALAPA